MFYGCLINNLNSAYGTKGVLVMGMTNKQFQGFIRLALGWLERALQESPENQSLIALKDIFQSMLEAH